MLTVFGSVAVTIMMLPYAFESRSVWAVWLILVFTIGSAATALYSAMVGVYPITAIEAIWSVVAVRRFVVTYRSLPQALG